MDEAKQTKWREVRAADLAFNPFTLIDKEWMLVTVGTQESHNTMTASWGGFGVLWKRYVSMIFVRPQRYSMEFLEREESYTLNFFDREHRKALAYCGSHSGREVDKDKQTGLTACFDLAAPYYEQARIVMVCRKLHGQMLDPACFLEPTIDAENYPEKDYHKLFIGEITKVLMRDG